MEGVGSNPMVGVIIRRDEDAEPEKDKDTHKAHIERKPRKDTQTKRGTCPPRRATSGDTVLKSSFSQLLINKLVLFKTWSFGYFYVAALAF